MDRVIFVFLAMAFAETAAADNIRYAMEIVDFFSLPETEQVDLVVSAFEDRLEFTSNLYYEFEIFYHNRQRLDADSVSESYVVGDCEIGAITWPGRKRIMTHWRLGESYRIDVSTYKSPGSDEISSISRSSFRDAAGVNRGLSQKFGATEKYARISTDHNSFNDFNRYIFWLTGPANGHGEHFIQYCVRERESLKIERDADSNLVKLSVPWKPRHHPSEQLGWRVFGLDPSRGFMPVWADSWWVEADDFWRRERFTVGESRLVDDFHLPVELRETVTARLPTQKSAPQVTIYETKVLKIEQGAVKESDLDLEFPVGTQVVDAIEGKGYVVGSNGEETHVTPLLVGTQLTDGTDIAGLMPVDAPVPRSSSWFWLLGLVFIIVSGLIGLAIRRRNSGL